MRTTARTYTGNQKQAVRLQAVKPGRVYHNILILPGEECLEVENYLDNNNINRSTTVTVVERYAGSLTKIQNRFHRYDFREVHYHLGLIQGAPDYGPYDLVNLDTCSSLSLPLLDWLAGQSFLPGGDCNLWLTAYRANRAFRDTLLASFLETREGLRTLSGMKDCGPNFNPHLDPVQLVTAGAIYAALNRYECVVEPMLHYCEHMNFMYVHRYGDLRPCGAPRPGLGAILVGTEAEDMVWRKDGGERKLANETMIGMCIKAAQGTPGERAYGTRQMRNEIANGSLAGKNPKMIRAGWKAEVTKRIRDEAARKRIHEFIDHS